MQGAPRRGAGRTRRSHREAHVGELFDEPVHDPGLVLFARCLHALERSEGEGVYKSHFQNFFLDMGRPTLGGL